MWNKTIIFSGILLLMSFPFQSCKESSSKKKTSSAKIKRAELPDSSWNKLYNYYPSFSMKAKVEYEDKMSSYSFIANIRIAHDSLIWASFTGPFGVEVARLLVDRDSVKIWNKLNGEKSVRTIAYLNKYLPFNPDYFLLEDFLLANPLNISRQFPSRESDSAYTTFSQDDVTLFISHKADMKNYTLSGLLLKDKMMKQQMDVTFESYRNIQEKLFSCQRTINIKRGEGTINISADIYKYGTASSLEFPFW